MKQLISYLVIMVAAALLFFTACKGNTGQRGAQADTGQQHVGNAGPADSGGYKITPTETGGKDTSGNGSGTTNAPKDTLQTKP